MSHLLLILGLLDLVICVYVGWQLALGGSRIRNLQSVEPQAADLPSVSVVVAARNEERDIEPALRSLLSLDYSPLEIIVVEDRSTDRTGEILDRIATEHPQLRVIHVTELPSGWLGKNHALATGAAAASGDLLLFTDADITMEPSALRRAVAFLNAEKIDHLAAFFRITMPTWLLESFVVLFTLYFFAHFKPWKVRDPRSSAHVGVGGFNLIRREVYQAIGTHQAIALRPDDDVKLGKLVKKHGFIQDVVVATESMSVPWYASVREVILGLEKNAFAGVDYRIGLTVVSSLFLLVFHFGPFVSIWFTTGWTRIVHFAVVASLLLLTAGAARNGRARMSTAFGFPLAVLMFVFIQWRTMVLNLWRGGIYWRDTFYPLSELRQNQV